jgi:monofunctional biosynthetic peptidoglycan transglycosylase
MNGFSSGPGHPIMVKIEMSFLRLFKKIKLRWLILGGGLALIVFFGARLYFTLPDVTGLKTNNPKTTALMELRKEQAEKNGKKLKIERIWISFKEIPQLLKNTVRIAEDAGFYWHKGIDYEELKEAIKKDIQERKFVRGGSTITQQLAKNLYLSTEKSLSRKIKEYLIAKRLEKALSKDRIFELYLNVIELGPGIFGVQAASNLYFDHSVEELNLEEIVRLTAIIPRPLQTDPNGKSGWLLWRGRWLLHKLLLYKYIDDETYQETVKIFSDS